MAFNRADFLMNNLALLKDTAMERKFRRVYALRNIPPESVIEYLLANGLIPERPAQDVIKRSAEEAEGDPSVFAINVLEDMHLLLFFDAETDMLPVDYDNLLNDFVANSQGVLKGLSVLNDVKQVDNSYKYTVSACFKEHGFVVDVPDDIGDWYDTRVVEALLDELLKYSGSAKRFIPVNSDGQTVEYIFGEPAKVKALKEEYDL